MKQPDRGPPSVAQTLPSPQPSERQATHVHRFAKNSTARRRPHLARTPCQLANYSHVHPHPYLSPRRGSHPEPQQRDRARRRHRQPDLLMHAHATPRLPRGWPAEPPLHRWRPVFSPLYQRRSRPPPHQVLARSTGRARVLIPNQRRHHPRPRRDHHPGGAPEHATHHPAPPHCLGTPQPPPRCHRRAESCRRGGGDRESSMHIMGIIMCFLGRCASRFASSIRRSGTCVTAGT